MIVLGARALALFACTGLAACTAEPRAQPAGADPVAASAASAEPTLPRVSEQPPPVDGADAEPPADAVADAVHDWPIPQPELSRVPAGADEVVLESAGAEPRRALRLSPSVGEAREVSLSMKMRVAMTLGTQAIDPSVLPTVAVKMKVTPGPAKDGATPYAFEVMSATRERLEGASARLLEAVDTAVEGMRRSAGRLVFDARGRRLAAEYGLPDVPTPGLRPSLAGFQQSFSQLFVVLPEAPVGTGARWVSTTHFEISGIPVAQRSTYELVAARGDTLALSVSFEQFATGEAEAPAGVALEDTQFGGRGSGTLTIGLDSPFPTEASAEARSRVLSSVTMGGQAQPVEMDLLSTLAITAGAG